MTAKSNPKKTAARWKIFAREYVIDLNGTRAAIRAGYSENGAEVTASRLLRNPKVQALVEPAIQELTIDEYTDGTGENARPVKRVRFRLSDKRASLELLGKHLKLFTEKVEHSGQVGIPVIVTNFQLPHST